MANPAYPRNSPDVGTLPVAVSSHIFYCVYVPNCVPPVIYNNFILSFVQHLTYSLVCDTACVPVCAPARLRPASCGPQAPLGRSTTAPPELILHGMRGVAAPVHAQPRAASTSSLQAGGQAAEEGQPTGADWQHGHGDPASLLAPRGASVERASSTGISSTASVSHRTVTTTEPLSPRQHRGAGPAPGSILRMLEALHRERERERRAGVAAAGGVDCVAVCAPVQRGSEAGQEGSSNSLDHKQQQQQQQARCRQPQADHAHDFTTCAGAAEVGHAAEDWVLA